jgi:outer membrane immunogenic protein
MGMAMKKSATIALLASASPVALLLGSSADAADLARKAPAPMVAPAPVYSWTGCYVGGHVGWGWGRNNYTESSTTNFFNSLGSFTRSASSAASAGVDTSGGLFGGQLGCNYQFAPTWVFGVQGDFAGTDFNGTGNDPLFPFTNSTVHLKTDWLASITARLGVTAFNNQALFYVKGGAAWDHNKWDVHNAAAFFSPATFSGTSTGWTIGGGAEWTLWSPNWTAFVEYNYYQFRHGPSATTDFSSSSSCGVSGAFTCTSNTHNTFTTGKQQINTVKVGVNYKFSGF